MTNVSTKRCPFCEKLGRLSGDHPFGRWCRPYVDMNRTRTIHDISRPVEPLGRTQERQTKRVRDNDPLRQKISSACVDCNTQWMSRIQDRTSAFAIPLVRGEFPYLEDVQRTTLATWAIMVTMNLEYFDPETVRIPQSQRTILMQTEAPPPHWYVAIARYQGTVFNGTFHHRAMGFRSIHAPNTVADEDNAQSTVFGLGKTLFHTVSAGSAHTLESLIGDSSDYGDMLGMRGLWPQHRGSLDAAIRPFDEWRAGEIIDALGVVQFVPKSLS
jgi:hypothetical protein